MIRKLIGLLAITWVLGFGAFMLTLAKPLADTRTDAIVVLTGGSGRLDRGLALLKAHAADRLLVSGVSPSVRPRELAARYPRYTRQFGCCVDLGTQAVDTRSNAEETAEWVAAHRYKSVRLVTSDWHMARARMELRNALGGEVTIVRDGVPSSPKLQLLLAEYHKLLLRRAALWLGVGT